MKYAYPNLDENIVFEKLLCYGLFPKFIDWQVPIYSDTFVQFVDLEKVSEHLFIPIPANTIFRPNT